MTRYLRGRVSSPEAAADLTQEAFIALWSAHSATSISNGRAYLFRAATNLAINHNRRERFLPFVDDSDAALGNLIDETASPERILLSKQELSIVHLTLNEFPPSHRKIFILSRIHGCTYDEIGRALDIPAKTAFSHMVRMLVRIQTRLDEAGR